MLSNLGARLNLLSRFTSSTSRRVIQKQYLFESNGSIFTSFTSAHFSTSIGVHKDKATKEDNRRTLFMHRMQKKINHEDFEGALSVYRKLRSLRLDDHVGVFNKLFNLAIAQDDPTKLEQVLSEMHAANVQPISKTLEILFPYLIEKDMRTHILKLVDQMKKHNIVIREVEIQESLDEYLKRPPKKEEELPKKEKPTKKKAKETDEEEKPAKKPKSVTYITNEKQLKKEIEKYLQSKEGGEADGSLKKVSSDKKSKKKSKKLDEDEDEDDQHEKKITKKGDSIKIKEKSVKTEVDKEGKTKKVTKQKSETVLEAKKTKKDQKKHEEDKKSNKKQEIIEEDEFDDEEFDDDEFDDDDEVIEKVEKKKKTKKISKKKTVKKIKKVSTK